MADWQLIVFCFTLISPTNNWKTSTKNSIAGIVDILVIICYIFAYCFLKFNKSPPIYKTMARRRRQKMQERSYVRQVPEKVELEALKEFYNSAPGQESAMGARRYKTPPKCFYVNEIGIRAVAERNSEALDFLIDEGLNSSEKSVRYMAVGFMGDLSHSHTGIRRAYWNLRKVASKEKDLSIKELAVSSMRRLRKQIKKKRK